MVRDAQLLAHLSRVQRVPHADLREGLPVFPHQRTISRWYRKLGDQLVIFPTFTLAAIGLGHMHMVVPEADESWLRFPYAVDHAWVTSDFRNQALYLHCVVPHEHQAAVAQLVRDVAGRDCTIVSTPDGIQQIPPLGSAMAVTQQAHSNAAVLREFPLAVPVIFEGWNRRMSRPQLWRQVTSRLNMGLRDYLPRPYRNKKSQITYAYEHLTAAGLFRQHRIRYAPLHDDAVEVLAVVQDPAVLGRLRNHVRSIDEYAGDTAIARLVGTGCLLDELLALPAGTASLHFVRKRGPRGPLSVRFCYEFLFNPKSGTWVFSPERVLNQLGRTT